MATQWEIKSGAATVELANGQAEVTFDVRNPGPVDDRATVDVVGSEQTQASWFSVAEPQRTVPHGGSVTFAAVVKPGEKAPVGKHWLSARVYSADTAPEENSVTSEPVSFEVKPPAEEPKSKLWLWLLIGGSLLAVVVGVVLFLVLSGDDEPPAEEPKLVTVPTIAGHFDPIQGALELQKAGLTVKVVVQISLDVPKGEVIGTKPPAQSTVKEGSEVTLIVSSGTLKARPSDIGICTKIPNICKIAKTPIATGP